VNPKSMLGEVFGMLIVSQDDEGKKVTCRCACGGVVDVFRSNLRKGNSKSCGCQRRIACAKRMSTHATG
jgi:hypothetical protein